MNKDQFLRTIRCTDGEKFRIDNVIISTPQGDLRGAGTLLAKTGRFILDVALGESQAIGVPAMPTGIVCRNDFWRLQGLIENDLEFYVRELPPASQYRGPADKPTLTFSTSVVELAPSGLDILTSREITEMFDALRDGRSDVPVVSQGNAPAELRAAVGANPTAEAEHQLVTVSFDAVLQNFDLIAHNGGTQIVERNDFLGETVRSDLDTFHGDVSEWRFGLINKDRDLHVHLRSKPEYRSTGERHDWLLFRAFLDSLAFTHGQHAWPLVVEHRRDGKLVMHRVQLNDSVARTPHGPFSEKLWFNAQVGTLKWDFAEALQKAYAFFAHDTTVTGDITELLYLFREAGTAAVPGRIRLLTLCSLFESLLRVIHQDRIALTANADAQTFEAARQWLCAELEAKIAAEGSSSAYERLFAIVKGAEAVHMRQRYQSVADYLQLNPPDEWAAIFALWQRARNPVSHHLAKNDASDKSTKEQFIAESRIAGAINCIILKLMGYSGFARRSTFENRYAVI
jgi:hypothetical protein